MVIRRDTSLDSNFRYNPPQVGDCYLHIKSGLIGEVTEVSNEFGCFYLRYSPELTKRYVSTGGSDGLFRRLTREEFADYRLSQANSNANDSWRE